MTQNFVKHLCVFLPKLVPPATWGVWGRLPTLQLLWGLNENQMGNLSVRAWSTPIPSLISTVLRSVPYMLESSRQVLYSEWWRQSWSLKKRWTAAPCYPKVKGREDSKGLLSCRRGNLSWVAKEPFYSHTMSLLILRQEVTQPPLTLQSSLWDQGWGYNSSWNVSFACFLPLLSLVPSTSANSFTWRLPFDNPLLSDPWLEVYFV